MLPFAFTYLVMALVVMMLIDDDRTTRFGWTAGVLWPLTLLALCVVVAVCAWCRVEEWRERRRQYSVARNRPPV